MVRGTRGRGSGGSYRGNSNYYRGSSGGGGDRRSSGYHNSQHGGSSSHYSSSSKSSYPASRDTSSYSYDSRQRDKYQPSSRRSDGRPVDTKRPYRASRDVSDDRKRSRHQDTRFSSYSSAPSSSSTYRRNEAPGRSSTSTRQTASSSRNTSYRSSVRDHHDTSGRRHSGSSRHNDSMGPPKTLPPRRIIRSSRVGLATSGRLRGSATRGGARTLLRNRRDTTDLRIMKSKLLMANQRDRARRIKIARLTSSLRYKKREAAEHKSRDRKLSSSSSSKKKSEKKTDDDDDEGESSNKVTSDSGKKKTSSKKKSDDQPDGDELNSKNGDEKGEENIEKDNEKNEDKDKNTDEDSNNVNATNDEGDSGKKAEKEFIVSVEKEGSKKKEERESKSKSPRKTSRRSSHIKLTCVHCRTKCYSFTEYSNHLFSRTHNSAMKRLALRQKAQLSQMRMKQRNAQREIENNCKEDLEDCLPQFCLLCRLNYRQPKAKHQLSEHHKNMKKFLMPYCNTCHLAFKSPMMYESHRCSLEHIRRKARNNESRSREHSEDEKEVDLANFMTVDSVGEIDGQNDEDHQTDEDNKEKVNVGVDHVKKTDAFYCDLCRTFFAIKDDEEAVLKKHCSSRSHLRSYLQYKRDKNLQAEAERIQRKESKDPKKTGDKDASNEKNEKETKGNAEETEETGEDKLWEDVDKDLGDLLREVGPEDDEEDGSVLDIGINERYDKFKIGDKSSKEMNGISKAVEEKESEVIKAETEPDVNEESNPNQ